VVIYSGSGKYKNIYCQGGAVKKIHWFVLAVVVLLSPSYTFAEEINRDYCNSLRKLSMSIATEMRKGAPLASAVSWAKAQEFKISKYLEDPQTVLEPLVYYIYGYQHDRKTTVGEIGNLVMGQCRNGVYGNIVAVRAEPDSDADSAPRSTQPDVPAEGTYSMGTGWPIAEGLVVTNYHVIAGYQDIVLVRTDKQQISASIYEVDKKNDIALLRVGDVDQLPPALAVTENKTNLGAEVFTIGYPHTDIMGSQPKLTSGIVNALSGFQDDKRTYQVSVAVQSGNSGGPLLNMNGEVVGIVTSKLSAMKVFRWTGDLPQNVNYAMKTRYLLDLLEQSGDMDLVLNEVPPGKAPLHAHAEKIKNSVMIVVAR
jgi:S1-C subfamily serine protease